MPWKPKPGVDLSKLREEIARLEPIVCDVYDEYGVSAVITSANNGKHGKNSYHYKDAAIDLRTKSVGDIVEQSIFFERLRCEIQVAYPSLYDVIFEGGGTKNSHIHIEPSPLLAKIMFGPPREVA